METENPLIKESGYEIITRIGRVKARADPRVGRHPFICHENAGHVARENIAALVVARKAVTSSARRVRELARVAEAVYAPGTFTAVSAPKKIPARRKQMVEKTQGQASVGVIG